MNESRLKAKTSISRSYLTRRLQESAFNSNHCIWLLADLKYFEANNGYIFAYAVSGSITYVALEPLPTPEQDLTAGHFTQALDEFSAFVSAKILVFIGVYSNCMQQLHAQGFQGLCVGKDPWVKLAESEPVGNKAKGVRSARNHAIKAGVTIEEWNLTKACATGGTASAN